MALELSIEKGHKVSDSIPSPVHTFTLYRRPNGASVLASRHTQVCGDLAKQSLRCLQEASSGEESESSTCSQVLDAYKTCRLAQREHSYASFMSFSGASAR